MFLSLTISERMLLAWNNILNLKLILGDDSPGFEDGHFDYHRALTICNLNIYTYHYVNSIRYTIRQEYTL